MDNFVAFICEQHEMVDAIQHLLHLEYAYLLL